MTDTDEIFEHLIDAISGDQEQAISEVARRAAFGERVALIVRPNGLAVVVNLDN